MTTREKGCVSGTEILIEGGRLIDVREAGSSEGTCMEVRQLFYNIPARRKFLRAESTESAHVEHQMRLHALAAPEVRFTFIKDGRQVFDLAGTHDWRVRISGLAGAEAASKLIEIPQSSNVPSDGSVGHTDPSAPSASTPASSLIRVRGYLLPSDYARKGRRQQFIFLNGRPIEDPAISRALRDGYRGQIADGTHPAAWLWIEMDPRLVDVNVHPAKKEVRFHQPHEVRNLIANAVEAALAPPPAQAVALPSGSSEQEIEVEPSGVVQANLPQRAPSRLASPPPSAPTSFPHHQEQQEEFKGESGVEMVKCPDFKLIGPLHDRYIVMQGEEGVVLLDPVAARERVVYEELLNAQKENHPISSQGLLVPELLELETLDAELVVRHASHFIDAGMQVESFGGSTVKVSSLPSFLKTSDVRGFLLELVDELHETVGTRKGKSMAYETFAAGLARRIGKREPCRIDHADALLSAMFACDLPYCTPDGRPTLIHISLNELDRKFGK